HFLSVLSSFWILAVQEQEPDETLTTHSLAYIRRRTMNPGQISIQTYQDCDPHRERKFNLHFFDHIIYTTVTSTPSVVRKWLRYMLHYYRYLRHKLVVGLGVQWLASSSRTSAASTLQLCIGSRCLLFQLRHAGSIPRFLERFLADPDITFVGVWNHSDAGRLRNYNLQVLGYGGVHKPSSVGMSNWDAYWLSVEQVQYACVDAVVSFLLGVRLEAWKYCN
ncbi:hypothetical protein LINPERHAP2_LOCUS15803, partial [Linum perenne]